jgi:hypothetical protein
MTAIALTEIVQPLVAANEAASAETATVNGESVATVANASSVAQLSVSPEGNQIDVTTEGASEVAVSVANVEDAAMAALAPSKMVVVAMKGGIGSDGGDQSISLQTLEYTTASLSPGSTEDFILESSPLFDLLTVFSAYPAWIRVYGTSAARAADTRTSPGGTPPAAGTDFYAEVVTTQSRKTIRLSPIPMVQGTNGQVFLRVANLDTQNREISLTLNTLQYGIPPEPPGPPTEVIFYYESPPSILATVAGVVSEDLPTSSTLSIVQLAEANALAVSGGSDNIQRYVYYEWNGESAVSAGTDLWTLEIFGRLSDSGSSLPDFDNASPLKQADVSLSLGGFSDGAYADVSLKYLAGQGSIDPDFEANAFAKVNGSIIDSETTVATKQQLTSLGHLSIQRASATNCVAHYNGQQIMSWTVEASDEFLPIVTIQSVSRDVPLVTTGQARLTLGQALYGTGTFTPPTEAFYSP